MEQSEPIMATPAKPSYKCFVIMPFSETTHRIKGDDKRTSDNEWTTIFTDWIKKAVESYPQAEIKCARSKSVPGNFVSGIISDINESALVIADLTGSKSNVYYELGVRHALKTGTIMITQDISAIPSDLRNFYCFQYVYTNMHHEYEKAFTEFKGALHEKIKHVIDNRFPSDSPVTEFLGIRDHFMRKKWSEEKGELVRLLEIAGEEMAYNIKGVDTCIDKPETQSQRLIGLTHPYLLHYS